MFKTPSNLLEPIHFWGLSLGSGSFLVGSRAAIICILSSGSENFKPSSSSQLGVGELKQNNNPST